MIQKLIFGFVFIVVFSFATCTKDTCNDEPAFREMAVVMRDSTQSIWLVDLAWVKGKDLPKAYFEQIHLITGDISHDGSSWKNDFAKVDNTLISSDTSMQITFHRDLIVSPLDTLDLHYQFSDRRNFINCEHPGSNDSYFLDIQLLFFDNAGEVGVGLLTWNETLLRGPF